MPWSGYASRRTEMIASSAASSTSETKSFWRFFRIVSLSMSNDARLMIEPALRAAFTAVLSIGCMNRFYYGGHGAPFAHPRRAVPHQPSRQHRRVGARAEDHGTRRPGAGFAAPFPGSRRDRHGRRRR